MAQYRNLSVSGQVNKLFREVSNRSMTQDCHNDTSVWDSDPENSPIHQHSCHQRSLLEMEWSRDNDSELYIEDLEPSILQCCSTSGGLGPRPPCYGKEASPERELMNGSHHQMSESRRRELSHKLKKMGRHVHGLSNRQMQVKMLAQL